MTQCAPGTHISCLCWLSYTVLSKQSCCTQPLGQGTGGKVIPSTNIIEAHNIVNCLLMLNQGECWQHPNFKFLSEEWALLCLNLQPTHIQTSAFTIWLHMVKST